MLLNFKFNIIRCSSFDENNLGNFLTLVCEEIPSIYIRYFYETLDEVLTNTRDSNIFRNSMERKIKNTMKSRNDICNINYNKKDIIASFDLNIESKDILILLRYNLITIYKVFASYFNKK